MPRYRRFVDMLELAATLQASRTGITLQQIADRFEVSRRTANRMLGALREVYVDIETTSRDGRKYWHLPMPSSSDPLQLPRRSRIWRNALIT